MTPSNDLFRKVYIEALKITENTFDYKPDSSADYPFIHIGETYDTNIANSELVGNLTQIIGVWGTRTQKQQIDEHVVRLHNQLIRVHESFAYHTRLESFNYERLPDNTTGTPLLHYRIEARFFYTKKGE